ncbi:hypothetical protein L4D08_25915 [Photobacterium chitinilyticum]|uniref:hypothetical protein n=1 Tax=Photobacterium chitinilyticum TaxID=2485123 RepID=UPI003D1317B1
MRVVFSVFSVFVILGCFLTSVSAAEIWSPASEIKIIFPQAQREDPNHPHSEKILVSLKNMAWLPSSCIDRNYFYIGKEDNHLYSLLMSAMFAKQTVQVSVTDTQIVGGACRATMIGSPTWN